MKFILGLLLFVGSMSYAQDIYVPPTGYQPPPKAEDILPIAPMRIDDRAEMPAQVFSSVDKSDMWEKYERGEGKNSKSTVLLADKNDKRANAKGSKNVKSVAKGKVDSKQKVAKLKKQKPAGKVAKAKAPANAKRQPASKKLPPKKKKK